MNVHPFLGSSGSDPPLAPDDWSMKVKHEGQGMAQRHTAIIERNGDPVCHISIGPVSGGEEGARSALALRARAWIADYLSREHTGETVFPPLHDL